ncbi:hypothetical protein EUX98_g5779 [Antrodiella citrinella]|uniref:Coenzyme Q-binding protein COQ10 START domain-containing protein n=1 Tax=Antrodiella citrinella TaxID=2447956 RepID=A0A4S4MQM9_9APHY|nr:hypothetical protein EUX98_g5779 [Antrodiella citrinella]
MLVRPAKAVLSSRLARPLFTLPDLSSLSPFSEPGAGPDEVQSYRERKVLPYRPSELYHIVADVASYPEFIPFCVGSRSRIFVHTTLQDPHNNMALFASTFQVSTISRQQQWLLAIPVHIQVDLRTSAVPVT